MQKELLPHLFTDVMYPAYLAGSSGSTAGTVSVGANSAYSHIKFKIKSDTIMRQKWCQTWLPTLVADIGRNLLLEELLQEVSLTFIKDNPCDLSNSFKKSVKFMSFSENR